MTRIFLAVLLVAFVPAVAHTDPPKQAGYIKAEVRGTLTFETGHGYVVSVTGSADDKPMRVWLRISENKVLAQQLQSLSAKTVLVRGALRQMDPAISTSVPPHAMYIDDFTIEAAK